MGHGKANEQLWAQTFERLSELVTRWTGSTAAFIVAVGIVVVWILLGPIFHYSDTWQLVINTGTTIVTFLMVFLIQRSQNKDALVVHLKLNELVAAMQGASNRLIDVEALSEEELRIARASITASSPSSRARTRTLSQSHSIEEARSRHIAEAEGARRNTEASRRL